MISGLFFTTKQAVLGWMLTQLVIGACPTEIVVIDNKPREVNKQFFGFWEFIEEQNNSGTLSIEKDGAGKMCISKTDLASIFGSKTLAGTFLEIQDQLANCSERIEHKNMTDLKERLINIINELMPASSNTSKDKFVLMRLLTHGMLLSKNMEFIEEFWGRVISEEEKLNSENPKETNQESTKLEPMGMLYMLIDVLCAIDRDFTPVKIEDGQIQHQNECESGKSNLSSLRNKVKHDIILKPAVLLEFLLYIFIEKAELQGKIRGVKLLRNMNDANSCMKLAAILPRRDIKDLLLFPDRTHHMETKKQLNKRKQEILIRRKYLKELLKTAFRAFDIVGIKYNSKARDPSTEFVSTFIKPLAQGRGLYYDYVDSNGDERYWIHVGNISLSKLERLGQDSIELFWRMVGNVFYAIGGTENKAGIDITVGDVRGNSVDPGKVEQIDFLKYGFWKFTDDHDTLKDIIYVSSPKLWHYKDNSKNQENRPSMIFVEPQNSNIMFEVDIINAKYVSGLNRVGSVFPLGTHTIKYTITKDHENEMVLKHFGEISQLKINTMTVYFLNIYSKLCGDNKVREELITMLKRKLKNGEISEQKDGNKPACSETTDIAITTVTFVVNEATFEKDRITNSILSEFMKSAIEEKSITVNIVCECNKGQSCLFEPRFRALLDASSNVKFKHRFRIIIH